MCTCRGCENNTADRAGSLAFCIRCAASACASPHPTIRPRATDHMRRQLTVLVVATMSLVLIAFVVPLGYLLRQVAADRAVGGATRQAQSLAPLVATVDP